MSKVDFDFAKAKKLVSARAAAALDAPAWRFGGRRLAHPAFQRGKAVEFAELNGQVYARILPLLENGKTPAGAVKVMSEGSGCHFQVAVPKAMRALSIELTDSANEVAEGVYLIGKIVVKNKS